jgi:hypothetical protein
MEPQIAARLALYGKWDEVKEKREPYTTAMFHKFREQVASQAKSDPLLFLGLHALVFDTQTLGIFTGSHVSEYAQSHNNPNIISRVPTRRSCDAHTALPIAFVAWVERNWLLPVVKPR